MKYKSKNTPPVGIFLTRSMFNTLFDTLGEFVQSEKEFGKTDFSHNAAIIERKLLTYSRAYSSEIDDHAAIYLYEKEAASLLELMIAYIQIGAPPVKDHYADFQKSYEQKPKRK